jgi:hypothetical protein
MKKQKKLHIIFTVCLSHILQTRLSIDKTKSLSMCHLMSLIGNSYR